ncbi:sugar nucleotide-binding protein [Planctomicrobium piriforme]|uniref:dTDP-4-dehydrorhamnose reductase n=1 Tax=Planctomicrobium piriforme TaxID=1576369 RepID=A0A1I3E5Q3_9PLAN|nr:sugar nucleotide-binding protein [Planctomicrobium piriforme]SFH94275.1 dTDP-4-dehydrorhamnose reductase [Planctomicrobium piriforme]
MKTFLVVGVDTIAGANVAASFSNRYRVAIWAPHAGYEIANCDALDPRMSPPEAIAAAQADCLIYCGPAARSSWEPQTKTLINDALVTDAQCWAHAAAAANVRIVMISSDAVFTGPWLFHDEDSHGVCPSYQAQMIRAAEEQVTELCPEALILRTNVFGWSAGSEATGWIEATLKNVETKRIVQQDHIRHAAPILATDMADILDRACQENLTGVYHVAGAERINPLQFTQRLADRFELPWLAMRRESSLNEPPQGFGEGECSLQTKKIRKDLCVAMPLLSESLTRLHAQAQSGYCEQLRTTPVARAPKRRAA